MKDEKDLASTKWKQISNPRRTVTLVRVRRAICKVKVVTRETGRGLTQLNRGSVECLRSITIRATEPSVAFFYGENFYGCQ